MNGRWHTREDVLGDLYRATGSAPKVDDLHFVYGERPPPQVPATIDDEMKIMFGDQMHVKRIPDQMDKPDLKGIVSMLRMVEQSEDEGRTIGPELKPNDIIYISKLNPNVREFVPKCLSPRKTPNSEIKSEENNNEKENVKPELNYESTVKLTKLENIDIHADGDKKYDEKPTNDDNEKHPKCDEKQSKGDEKQLKYDDKHSKGDRKEAKHDEQLTNGVERPPQHDVVIEKLHNKICEAAQHDTVYHKREKNAAIATLLKLHSKKPIKLYTPEFFENSKATDFKGADEDSSPDIDEVKIDDGKEGDNFEALASEAQETKSNEVKLDDNPKCDENVTKEDLLPKINVEEEPIVNVEIQQSIEKVTNWFDGVTYKPKVVKTPEPILNTSQFAYKRKETISPASNKSSIINKKIPRPVESYKPSSYAKELREKYAARKKEMEKKQVANIWDKLDEELKKRDEKVLAKAREETDI